VSALVARGLSVVGLDGGRVAAGAAGRNGGFLLGGPAWFLHDAVARWGEGAVSLYQETLAELDNLSGLLGPEVVHRVGSIRLAGLPGEFPNDDELADLDAHEAVLRHYGVAVQRYNGPLGTGLLMPDDAAMNPVRRVMGLASWLRHRARLHESTVVRGIGPRHVVTDRGTVQAGVVVVAVDGGLERVVPSLRGAVRTARLQMLATEPVLPGRLPCPVYGRWGYDYAQQTPDGRLYVGGGRDRFVEDEWTDSTEPTAPVQDYIEMVAGAMAGHRVQVTHRWAASVGFTQDGRPLCVEVDDGVVAIGGYNGTGNLVGPVAARAAVALVLDRTPPPPYLTSSL